MTNEAADSFFRKGGVKLAEYALLTCGCCDGSRGNKTLCYKCMTCIHLRFCNICQKLKESSKEEGSVKQVEHQNICDGCGRFPIKGLRFKCRSCEDYDLCECCKNQNIHPEHDFAIFP